ncbi:MAG: DPP IV N-terminal domain-containing protein, partial [Bacteroidota bacterium]
MRKSMFIISCLVVTFTAFPQQKLFTVQDVHGSAKFSGKSLQGVRWMKDGKRFSFQELDTTSRAVNVWSYSVSDGKREMVAEAKALVLNAVDPPFRFTTYQWSPDEEEILFVSAPPEKQYLSRLTPGGNFFLYEVASKTFRRLTNVSEAQYNQKLSPDGKWLGFVRGNNIHLINLASGQESQLTSDGLQHIINGKFDWVYEEEFG